MVKQQHFLTQFSINYIVTLAIITHTDLDIKGLHKSYLAYTVLK